ncbi:MAG: hypothetical protein RIB43_09880 [Rhodospirillaceae bacterium]
MKLRDPDSFCFALLQIKQDLTEARCAELVEKTTSMVRKWTDPGHHSLPSLQDALILEIEHISKGHSTIEHAPILSLWNKKLREVDPENDREISGVVNELLDVPTVLGRLTETVVEATLDGEVTELERLSIKNAIQAVHRELNDLEEAIDKAAGSKKI